MNKVVFSSAFLIGHETIDNGHKELVELLNNMIDAVLDHDTKTCSHYWPLFTRKLESHFRGEEKIKSELGFKNVVEDEIRSREILKELDDLSCDCMTVEDWQNCLDEVAHNLMPFILRSDLPFGEHLIKIGYKYKKRTKNI